MTGFEPATSASRTQGLGDRSRDWAKACGLVRALLHNWLHKNPGMAQLVAAEFVVTWPFRLERDACRAKRCGHQGRSTRRLCRGLRRPRRLAGRILDSEKQRSAAAERHLLRRVGAPADQAAAAAFLVSRDSGWITGQVLGVGGGLGSLRRL